MSTFELYIDKSGQFRFRFVTDIGEKLLTSKGYRDKASALAGIASAKASAVLDRRFERDVSDDGNDFFQLRDANREVIAGSRSFATKSSMVRSIAFVKETAPDAGIDDKS